MFDCKDCCFAKMDNGKQTECLSDKHKYTADEQKLNEDGVFSLDRLCLYKRKSDWEKDKTDEERVEIARDQLFPNIGVCLDDDSQDPNDLENIINQILNVDYPINRIGLVIYSNFSKAGARIPKILSNVRSKGVMCSAVFMVEDNPFENETSIFKKLADATFLTRLSSKSKVDINKSFNTINKLTNDELKQLLVFKNEDALFINKTYVSRSYLEFLDYKKMEEAIYKKVVDTEFLHIIT